MTERFRVWLITWFRVLDAITAAIAQCFKPLVEELDRREKIRDEAIAELAKEVDSLRKQIEDLRRLLTVQEKPRAKVHAASFRDVRQFVGEENG